MLLFLINLINDDAFVSAATADACFMVHLVYLFMKTHLLALLQAHCFDLVRCASLLKMSGCVRNETAQWRSVSDLTTHAILVCVSMTSSCSVNGSTICLQKLPSNCDSNTMLCLSEFQLLRIWCFAFRSQHMHQFVLTWQCHEVHLDLPRRSL